MAKFNFDVTNWNMYKDAIDIIISIVKDTRIDKNIRLEYFDRLAESINIEEYDIELPEGDING